MLTAYAAECRAAGHRPATIRLRLKYLDRVPDLTTATRGDLVTWLAGHDWSPESLKAARGALRSFYGWAVVSGARADNPAATLRAVHVPAGKPHPTPDDVVDVALLRGSDRDRLMIGLAAWAGLRRAEIAELAWADVTGTIRVAGKGGKVRHVEIAPRLGDEISTERARRHLGTVGTGYRYTEPDSPWLFPGRYGGPMLPDSVGQAVKRALGGTWSVHSLRHRYATRAYAATRDLLTLQDQLGHSKPETTARYAAIPAGAAAAIAAAAAA